MLQPLFGSSGAEKVLMYMTVHGEGYPREIARVCSMGLYPVQRQLERLERGGILVSRTAGRTRLYSFNPGYPLLRELRQMLDKALSLSPPPGLVTAKEPAHTPEPAEALPESTRRMTQAELAAYVQARLRGKRD